MSSSCPPPRWPPSTWPHSAGQWPTSSRQTTWHTRYHSLTTLVPPWPQMFWPMVLIPIHFDWYFGGLELWSLDCLILIRSQLERVLSCSRSMVIRWLETVPDKDLSIVLVSKMVLEIETVPGVNSKESSRLVWLQFWGRRIGSNMRRKRQPKTLLKRMMISHSAAFRLAWLGRWRTWGLGGGSEPNFRGISYHAMNVMKYNEIWTLGGGTENLSARNTFLKLKSLDFY